MKNKNRLEEAQKQVEIVKQKIDGKELEMKLAEVSWEIEKLANNKNIE